MNRPRQGPVRRRIVVTATLLVAVAVTLVILSSWLDRPSTDDGIETDVLPAAPQAVPEARPEAEPGVAQTDEATSAVAVAEDLPPSSRSIETLRVALLPARADDADPAAKILADAIRQATFRTLRGMADVAVIDIGPAELAVSIPASQEAMRVEFRVLREANRQHDSDVAAEIRVFASNETLCWAVGVDMVRSGTSGSVSQGRRIRRNGDPGPGNDPESIGIDYAEAIAVGTREREAVDAVRIDARNVFIDATRPEDERMRALATMGVSRLDPEMTATAVELATRSASAETRKLAWNVLRRVQDPALAQSMNIALQSDPDAAVRVEAALGLGRYPGVAGVDTALAQAALGDASADVRLAARMVTMDAREQRDFMIDTLLDRSLTPAERMAPRNLLSIPWLGSLSYEGRELADVVLAYTDIISGTGDPEVKVSALSELEMATMGSRQRLEPDPATVRMLIEAATAADERVQRAALRAMRPFADHPEIRAALESVLEADPEFANELNIAGTLARPQDSNSDAVPPTFGARPPPC